VKISEGGAAIYRLGIELLDVGLPGNLVDDEVDTRKTTRKEAVLMYICRKPPSKRGFECKCVISCGSPGLAV
jgi:hypothetical protein